MILFQADFWSVCSNFQFQFWSIFHETVETSPFVSNFWSFFHFSQFHSNFGSFPSAFRPFCPIFWFILIQSFSNLSCNFIDHFWCIVSNFFIYFDNCFHSIDVQIISQLSDYFWSISALFIQFFLVRFGCILGAFWGHFGSRFGIPFWVPFRSLFGSRLSAF